MPFIWNSNPNIPPANIAPPIGPTEVSYEVHVVANTVNAGGSLSYNTPNVGYDVIYELDSLNVRHLQVRYLNAASATINTANITSATINVAIINTANITNATIQYGFMGSNPNSNLQIATKEYADMSAANVPSGGSDLQNIIDAKGDLLVGIAANTATRLPVGSNGQILTADSSTNSGLRWVSTLGLAAVHNLWIQTHWNIATKNTQVLLRRCDEIIMNDGTLTSGWENLVADITVSGVGGLDIGSEANSHWYEVYAIRKNIDDTRALLLHRAQETLADQSLTTSTDNGRNLRRGAGGESKIAQSFIPAIAGPLTSAEVEVSRTGSPTGLIWLTLETDDANNPGFPSGTALANSRVMDVGRLPTDKARMRFLFDTNASVSLSTTYHIVYQGDYTISDTVYTTIWGVSANGYANGRANEFRIPTSTWRRSADPGGPSDLYFKTFVKGTPITELTLPGGYDQWCLLSYAYNNSSGNFKSYVQKDRTLVQGIESDWRAFTANTGLVEAVDLTTFIPPVPCAVKFHLWTAHDSPNVASVIGGVASTDLLITGEASGGAAVANTKGTVTAAQHRGVSVGPFNFLLVEDQVILARLQNVNSRLYSVAVSF